MARTKMDPEDLVKARARRKANSLKNIKDKLESGRARDLSELGDDYSFSLLKTDLAMSYTKLMRKIENPSLFDIGEIKLWAELIGVKYEILRDFIHAQTEKPKK